MGKWKLMAMDGRPVAIFDLDADPLEDTNLLEKQPEMVGSLAAEVRSFLMTARDRSGFGNIGPEERKDVVAQRQKAQTEVCVTTS